MQLSIGSILMLLGVAIMLVGGCALIGQSFKLKRDNKVSLSRHSMLHGVITILLSCIGVIYVFVEFGDFSAVFLLLMFFNIVLYLVGRARLQKSADIK